jgi:hypothetical protein
VEHLADEHICPTVEVITGLSVLYTDRARLTADEAHAIAQAVALLRTHALPDAHPWAVS